MMVFREWYEISSRLMFTIGLFHCQSALILVLLVLCMRVLDWANVLLQLTLKEVLNPETKCEYLFQSSIVKGVQFKT